MTGQDIPGCHTMVTGIGVPLAEWCPLGSTGAGGGVGGQGMSVTDTGDPQDLETIIFKFGSFNLTSLAP